MHDADTNVQARAENALRELAAKPDDLAQRERAARALAVAERHGESVELLQEALIHFNAHQPGFLPCLCRRCLRSGETAVETQGKRFVRDFVVAPGTPKGRVLFFWMPENLVNEERRVRRSVGGGLRARASVKSKKA